MGIAVENSLKEWRKRKKLTQEQLAQELGVTRQTVISIERSEYVPTTGLSLRIARYFGTNVEKIFWLDS